jgi:hypothetical protein
VNLYFLDNFDTDIAGALPVWFTSVVGTWQVTAGGSLAYSSPNILSGVSHADGDVVVLAGGGGVSIPATADMGLYFVSKSFDGTGNGFTPLVRYSGSSSAQNWYGFLITGSSGGSSITFQLYKSVGGSAGAVGGSQTVSGIAWSTGTSLAFRVAAIGSTISAKVWLTGSSEPGGYQVNITDVSLDTPGYAAFRFANSGGSGGNGIDNLEAFGNSSLAAGAITSSGITGSTATLSAVAPTGGSSPYTYQWYRSTSAGFVPQSSNMVSGPTSLVLNDSGLNSSTTYYYLQVVTDSTGAIAWSSQASITTSAGALTSGTSSASSITSTGCSVTNTGASGGTSPYLYQWYRSTTSGFTPGSGNIISGASTLIYMDSGLSPSTTYYYKLVSTDLASSTVTAAQISVTTSAPASLTAGSVTPSNIGSTTATLTSTSASGGYPAYSYQWYRSTTPGFTPGSGYLISGGTSLTLNDTSLSPSTTCYYVIEVTDSHSSTAFSSQASLTTSATFSAGTAYATYVGVKTVQLSASNAIGGSGTYTYQWYRSTTAGSNGTAISGATTEAYIDTSIAAATTYYYALQYTDTTGGAQVLTAQVHVTTKASSALEIVGGFGDSIEEGAYSTVQSPFSAMIDQLNFGMPSKEWYGGTPTNGPNGTNTNLSLNYSVSGSYSNNWLPGGSYLPAACTAWAAAGVTRLVTELGGADAQESVANSASTYRSNMAAIIAYIQANVPTLKSIHLFGVMSQNEASGNESVINSALLIQYDAEMTALSNGSTVFHVNPLGPFNYFQRRANSLQRSADLVHPNDYGDQAAGAMWATEVIVALTPSGGPATLAGYSRSRVVNG